MKGEMKLLMKKRVKMFRMRSSSSGTPQAKMKRVKGRMVVLRRK
jgi:hypothetical protein